MYRKRHRHSLGMLLTGVIILSFCCLSVEECCLIQLRKALPSWKLLFLWLLIALQKLQSFFPSLGIFQLLEHAVDQYEIQSHNESGLGNELKVCVHKCCWRWLWKVWRDWGRGEATHQKSYEEKVFYLFSWLNDFFKSNNPESRCIFTQILIWVWSSIEVFYLST